MVFSNTDGGGNTAAGELYGKHFGINNTAAGVARREYLKKRQIGALTAGLQKGNDWATAVCRSHRWPRLINTDHKSRKR